MESANIALLLASGMVGCLIGTVGIGGILLIPVLIGLAGLTPHQASATALFTFIFTGVLGTVLYQRKGSIDWRQTLVVCAGAIIFSYLGAVASSFVDGIILVRVIALLIFFAGLYIFIPEKTSIAGPVVFRRNTLIVIGAAAGFGSGFSGAGGPLFSVPLMVIAGFSPLSAIGTSQVLQFFSAASGTLANLRFGDIYWPLVVVVTFAELFGVLLGAAIAHAVSGLVLKRLAGALCLIVGARLLFVAV